MVRSTLALAVVAAVLCVALSAPIDEQQGPGSPGCDIAVKNVENKAKDIVKKVQKIEKIPSETDKKLAGCAGQISVPQLAALCVKNIVTNDENKVKNNGKDIEKDLEQLEKQLEKLVEQCGGGGGGGSRK